MAEPAAVAVAITTRGQVDAVDGQPVTIDARTVCVHGDTPGAATIVGAVRAALTAAAATVVVLAGRCGRAPRHCRAAHPLMIAIQPVTVPPASAPPPAKRLRF